MTVVQTAYLGSINYYKTLLANHAGIESINTAQIYDKKLHLNRCRILAANGPLMLTVPAIHPPTATPISDVRIDNHETWQHRHWISIVSAYKTSPFFDYLMDDIEPFYKKKYEFLIDINNDLLEWTLKALGERQMKRDVSAGTLQTEDGGALRPYHQVFGQRHGFIPDLSILDLICNLGPEAADYLLTQTTIQ